MAGKLNSIQVLRAVAVIGVVVFHATGDAFVIGAAGVDLFFIISGFIITRISAGREPVAFMTDRLWRIFPLYLLCSAVFLLIVPVERSLCRDAVSLTLLPLDCAPYLKPGWTLPFELFFYGLTALFISRRMMIFPAVVALVTIGLVAPLGPAGDPLLLEFLFGVIIARLPLREELGLPLFALAALIYAVSPDMNYQAVRAFWWGVPSALVVYGALSLERHFKEGPTVEIGNASYSIYLTHMLVLVLLPVPWPLAVIGSICFGYIVHRTVELPLLRLKPIKSRASQPA